MSDRSNKESQPVKEPKQASTPSLPRDPKWIVAGGLALGVVFYGLYYTNNNQDRNLADITRPPAGFEAFEEIEEDPMVASDDSLDGPDVSESYQKSVDSDDAEQLRVRLQELEQAIYEKDRDIADLTQQLADQQHHNTPQTYPVIEKTTVKESSGNTTQRNHTVKKGETLSEIARHYYGSGTRWKEIYEANSEKLGDKNRVRVGTILLIPE